MEARRKTQRGDGSILPKALCLAGYRAKYGGSSAMGHPCRVITFISYEGRYCHTISPPAWWGGGILDPSSSKSGGGRIVLGSYCVLLEEGELKKVFEDTGTRVEVVDCGRLREFWKIVSAILKIRHLVKQHRADLVLGWMTKAHIYCGPAAMLAGVPAIYCQLGLPDNTPVDRLSRLIPATGALTCSDSPPSSYERCQVSFGRFLSIR